MNIGQFVDAESVRSFAENLPHVLVSRTFTFFCSDPVNQAPVLGARPFANPRNADDACAVSWVGQAPAGAAKVALWAYHVVDPSSPLDKTQHETTLILRRGDEHRA